MLVAGHDLKFFLPLQRALEETGRFEFKQDVWQGHQRHDARRSAKLLDWAQIIVCEWCLGNAVWYAKHKKPGQRLVSRFHLQERVTPFPRQLDLDAVSRIVFVGSHIEREAHERIGLPPEKTCVIPNIVDVERFALPKRTGAFFNLGMIGIVPRRKRLDRAVELLEALKQRDDRYVLHIKGTHPTDYDWLWARTLERHYYAEQFERINLSPWRNSIVFDPPGDDVPAWLRGIGFVLSPSDFESFHMAVAECMASGGIPVIWSWEGARDIYPERYLVGSVQEAAERIDAQRRDSDLERLGDEVRGYVRDHFDRDVIRDLWLRVLLPDESPAGDLASRLAERILVVVYAIDNWKTFHRREMLEALAAHLRDEAVFLVVEPGSHARTIQELGWATSEELQSYARLQPIQTDENIWTFRSLTDGVVGEMVRLFGKGAGRSPGRLLREQIRRMFPGMKRVLHWLYKPDLKGRWLEPGDAYVYECYDDYTRDFGTGRPLPEVEAQERDTLRDARAAFFTSETLFRAKADGTPNPVLAGNGVAYQAFARHRREEGPKPGTPTVGYLGNLSDFFDWESMYHAAKSLPQVAFRFMGPLDPRTREATEPWKKRLEALPNCTFTGRLDRDQGARAIADCHALLIPFVQNEAMDAVNPLKLWEYFATGLPVVATPLEALQEWSDLFYPADSPEAWVQQIQAAITEDDPDHRRRRVDLARKHDWAEIVQAHARVLRNLSSSL